MTLNQISATAGSSEDYFLIGISDSNTEGMWKTTASDHQCKVNFTNWGQGQPDNSGGEDCAALISSLNWEWLDIPCSFKHEFVCQLLE